MPAKWTAAVLDLNQLAAERSPCWGGFLLGGSASVRRLKQARIGLASGRLCFRTGCWSLRLTKRTNGWVLAGLPSDPPADG